jgi:hypothetical protein
MHTHGCSGGEWEVKDPLSFMPHFIASHWLSDPILFSLHASSHLVLFLRAASLFSRITLLLLLCQTESLMHWDHNSDIPLLLHLKRGAEELVSPKHMTVRDDRGP